MSEPVLEIRRRPTPQHYRMFAFRLMMLLVGLAHLVPSIVALVSRPLDGADRMNAAFLVAAGGFLAGTGLVRTWSGRLLVTPAAAAVSIIQGRTSAGRVPVALAWLREHRPQVPVVDEVLALPTS